MATDTQISQPAQDKDRDLVPFFSSSQPLNQKLEDLDDGEKFDQFRGKRTTYKDELYTTRIDHTQITEERKHKAHQVERELGKGGNTALDKGEDLWKRGGWVNNQDEEMKYSGVHRSDKDGKKQKNKSKNFITFQPSSDVVSTNVFADFYKLDGQSKSLLELQW